MAKRKMSEKSLANLETEKYKFSADNPERAKKAQEKAIEKYYENKQATIKRDQANEYIWEKIGVPTVEEVLTQGTTQQKLDLLKAVLPKDVLEQKLSGSLDIQKIFITPEEKKETDDHIDNIIAESYK